MEGEPLHILIIDDDEDDFILIREMLRDIRGNEYQAEWAPTYRQAEVLLDKGHWDVIFVDYDLGNLNGLDLIREAVKNGIKTPLIMITGRGRYELDVDVMNSGAADYLTKNMINPAFLERVIRYSIERSHNKEILEHLVQERTAELQNALEELRVVEEELRTQHEELLQSNLQTSDQGTIQRKTMGGLRLVELITDRQGVIVTANQEAANVFLTDNEALKGKLLSLFISISERKRFVQLLAHLDEIVSPYTDQFSLSTDDTLHPLKWCTTLVPLKTGWKLNGHYYWLLHPLYPGNEK